MHFKAEIGPFPITQDGKVNMEGKFFPVVVLEESGYREVLITLLAERLCGSVAETCKRFIPFLE